MRNYTTRFLGMLILCIGIIEVQAQIQAKDTIWVDYSQDHGLHVKHVVSKGETLYALSKIFNSEVDRLREINMLEDNNIRLSDTLLLPLSVQDIAFNCRLDEMRAKGPASVVVYRVRPGDNIFHIHHRVFEKKSDCLVSHLEAKNGLKFDQLLSVGLWRPSLSEEPWSKSTESDLEEQFWNQMTGKKVKYAQGAAKLSPSKLNKAYVLFDGAEKGSIIRLSNPMNTQVCYAEVVGEIPIKLKRDNILVVSQLVLNALGARDERFRISVEFFE